MGQQLADGEEVGVLQVLAETVVVKSVVVAKAGVVKTVVATMADLVQ